jgi:hypothetical protein
VNCDSLYGSSGFHTAVAQTKDGIFSDDGSFLMRKG